MYIESKKGYVSYEKKTMQFLSGATELYKASCH